MSLSCCLPCRYSAMKEYLSELDKETKKTLETFYGFSEGKSKVRRSVDEWNSTGSEFFRQIPLLKVEDFSRMATDLHSGQKRKIEGRVFHKDSSIVNSGDSNDIIGFQLVSVTVPWPASSLWGSKGLFGVSVPPAGFIARSGGFAVHSGEEHPLCSSAQASMAAADSSPALRKRSIVLKSSQIELVSSITLFWVMKYLVISLSPE